MTSNRGRRPNIVPRDAIDVVCFIILIGGGLLFILALLVIL